MDKRNKIKIDTLVLSIIQMFMLIVDFVHAEYLVGVEMADRLRELSGFGIFIMVIVFATILWDEIKYTKIRLMWANIILFFLIPNVFFKIIVIINLLCLAFVKSEKRSKLNMAETTKQLSIEPIKLSKANWIAFVLLLFIYFGQNFIKSEWLEMLSPLWLVVFVIALHLIIFILAIITFYGEIKSGIKVISKNFKLTIRYIVNLFVKMVLIMFVATLISVAITNKMSSVNQESIESMPIYMTILLAVLWAPVVEEAVFRGCIRKVVKHKFVFVVLSGTIFGFLHAIQEATFAIALATSLPYVVIGMVFACSYMRTNNLAINMLFHMLYNSLAVLVTILK